VNDPAELLARMTDLEEEIACLDNDWARAESDRVHARAQWEWRRAQLRLTLRASNTSATVPDLDALVTDALWQDPSGVAQKLADAEGRSEAFRVSFKAKQSALSSMKQRLDALVRQSYHSHADRPAPRVAA